MNSEGINVLSLFNGMGCIWIALDKLGIKVNKRYSSEIDKNAIRVNDFNYPDTIQLGDVTKLKGSDLEDIDLLVGGSPCQGFSFAGKKLNFDDTRSKLFFEFVRLLDECRPKYFLLENVRMKKESEDIITDTLMVEPQKINSSLVSAQNRLRFYWTNIRQSETLQDKGEVLEDIVCEEAGNLVVDSSYSNLTIQSGENRLSVLEKNHNVKDKRSDKPLLSAVIKNDTPSGISRQSDRVYSIKGKSPCLTCVGNPKIDMGSSDSSRWRFLTVQEKEALQTVPVGYTSCLSYNGSNTVLGNGWTVDVIAHLLKGMDCYNESDNLENPL